MSAVAPANAVTAPDVQGIAAALGILAQAGGLEALLGGQSTSTRDNRLHIGYGEAAERLNVPEKWLRERISTLPHRKFGKFVQFTEEDLHAISDMHFVSPGTRTAQANDAALNDLQPSKRSRKRP